MAWLKSNWRSAILNLIAFSALIFVLTQGSSDWSSHAFDPELESAKWAVRFLLTCLAMTPFNTYLGWGSAPKLRKPAGLWAFAFAGLHVLFYIKDTGLTLVQFPIQPFIGLGFAGLTILTALAITSNRRAMRRLGKNWKRVHRLVYVAGLAVTSHAILATTASKRIAVRDPQSIHELQIYLAVLVVLLVVRLPFVRRLWQPVVDRRRSRHYAPVSIVPVTVRRNTPAYPPLICAGEERISMNEYLGEFAPAQDSGDEQDDTPASVGLPLAR